MPQTLTIRLAQPVASAQVLNSPAPVNGNAVPAQSKSNSAERINPASARESESQRAAFLQASKALNSAVARINKFYEELFAGHKAEIARLSVEIARKILMQKVETGDYRIESIVQEALENTPTRNDVVVHLNSEDLAQYQKAQQDAGEADFEGIKFIADPTIGRAECLVENPKGITKFLIDENLERISKALMNAE